MKSRFLIVLLLLSGCAGKPPEGTYFLMRADSAGTAALSQGDVGIGRVQVAKYLDQQGIVLETAPHQLQIARLNLWAEPLDKSIRSTLAGQLSLALGSRVQDDLGRRSSWRLQVDVKIDQLHGTHDGRALLVASWWVSDGKKGEPVAQGRFESSEALLDSGYPGLVASELSLLDSLSGEIGQAISGLSE